MPEMPGVDQRLHACERGHTRRGVVCQIISGRRRVKCHLAIGFPGQSTLEIRSPKPAPDPTLCEGHQHPALRRDLTRWQPARQPVRGMLHDQVLNADDLYRREFTTYPRREWPNPTVTERTIQELGRCQRHVRSLDHISTDLQAGDATNLCRDRADAVAGPAKPDGQKRVRRSAAPASAAITLEFIYTATDRRCRARLPDARHTGWGPGYTERQTRCGQPELQLQRTDKVVSPKSVIVQHLEMSAHGANRMGIGNLQNASTKIFAHGDPGNHRTGPDLTSPSTRGNWLGTVALAQTVREFLDQVADPLHEALDDAPSLLFGGSDKERSDQRKKFFAPWSERKQPEIFSALEFSIIRDRRAQPGCW